MDIHRPSYRQLKEVAETIRGGGVMVYPTDTIYGLGCDIYSAEAIARISSIKKRDKQKPYSFVCENISQISEFAFLSNWGYKLLKRCLPGPYTFILEARKTNIPVKSMGKRSTVGVRIPDNPICLTLMKILARPIISTSVNIAGGEPLVDPVMLQEEFTSKIDVAISVGPLVSDPSTVIDVTGSEPVLIRQGKGEIPW